MGRLYQVSLTVQQTGYTCFLVAGSLISTVPFPYPRLLACIGEGTKGGVGGINAMILAAFRSCATDDLLRAEFTHLLKANSWWSPDLPRHWDMIKNSPKGLTGALRTAQVAKEKAGREMLASLGNKLNQDSPLKGLGLARHPNAVKARGNSKPLADLLKLHGPLLIMGKLWGKSNSSSVNVFMSDEDGVVQTHTTGKFNASAGHAVILCGIGRDDDGIKRYVYRDPGHAGHYRSKPVDAFPDEVEVWFNPALSGGSSSSDAEDELEDARVASSSARVDARNDE